MRMHNVGLRVSVLQPVESYVDVLFPRLQDGSRHIVQSHWPVDLQPTGPPDHGRSQNHIRITHSMVGVQVRDEHHPNPLRRQPRNAVPVRLCHAPDDSRPAIHQVGRAVDHNGRRGPEAVRVGIRRPRPQHHHLGLFLKRGRRSSVSLADYSG